MKTRYVFFVSGHILVHPPLSAKLERYTTPFETVLTIEERIEDETGLDVLRKKAETEARKQMAEAAPKHLVADVTIRNLSLLHAISDGEHNSQKYQYRKEIPNV